MTAVVVVYFFEVSASVRLVLEAITLAIGIYGIYAQSMIYRIKARPSWDRFTTNLKFFGVAYIGAFLLAFISGIMSVNEVITPLVTLGMLGALAQLFFSYEDLRGLDTLKENQYQLQRSKRLLNENFKKVRNHRFASLFVGGVLLPLVALVFLHTSPIFALSVLGVSLLSVLSSELADRFLFYSTVVPLGMAGGFFVGKQR
jgi:DMSO reductase anchor subunit